MFNRPLIAIDIGSSAIKVVELAGAKQKKLSAIGLELLPAGAVVDGALAQPEPVEKILGELLKKLNISTRGRRAALSLGGTAVLIKRAEIAATGAELDEQAFATAEQHFQTDMAELEFDHFPLSPQAARDGGTPLVLVGAKRETVEPYVQLIRNLGMRLGCIECNVFSSANMFEYNYGAMQGLMALINIGASNSQVSMLGYGDYLFSRDIAIAGEEYTRQIMEALGVPRENAEHLKVAVSQGDANVPPEVMRVLGSLNEQLVNEIQVTIDYFFQSGDAPPNAAVQGIFLTGGGSRVLGFDAALAAAMQIPVTIVNPFQKIEIPKKFTIDYITMQSHLYGVAVGLGLRSMGDKG